MMINIVFENMEENGNGLFLIYKESIRKMHYKKNFVLENSQ